MTWPSITAGPRSPGVGEPQYDLPGSSRGASGRGGLPRRNHPHQALGVQTPSIYTTAQRISDALDSLDGTTDLDQVIGTAAVADLVPTDANGLAFSRTAAQVLNIAYLNPEPVTSGGFFPAGVNSSINTSGDNDAD
ncbi:UNVERIFIED_ORG: hypothetical protein ABIB52_001900 [Arthrobacter sp. UYCu721]